MILPRVDVLCRIFFSLVYGEESTNPIPGTCIEDIHSLIIQNHILPFLGKKDLDNASLVNRKFCQLSRDFQSIRVRSIAVEFPGERRLPATRIRCPRFEATFEENSSFLFRLERRIVEMNRVLPEEFRSPCSPESMAFRIDAHLLANFFQNGYLFSLKQCLGSAAAVSETDGLEESAVQIRTWLARTDVSSIDKLDLQSRHIVCFPKELCLLTDLEIINAENNGIDFLPEEMELLTGLKLIKLYQNPVRGHSSELSKLERTPASKIFKASKIAYIILVLGIAHIIAVTSSVDRDTEIAVLIPLSFFANWRLGESF